MPSIYLDKNDLNRQIAEAVRRLYPWCQVNDSGQWITIVSSNEITIKRRALEEAIGRSMTEEEWKTCFARNAGEVFRYDANEYTIGEYLPGDS